MAVRDKKTNSKGKQNGVEVVSLVARTSSLALSRAQPERIIRESLKDIRKALGADACWLLCTPDVGIEFKSVGWPEVKQNEGRADLSGRLSLRMLEPIYPLRCNDIRKLYKISRPLHRFLRAGGAHRFMGVILKRDHVPIGALSVSRGLESPDFTKEDLRLLGALGAVLSPIPPKAQHVEFTDPWSLAAAIIDNLPNPAFVKDKRHRWVLVNPGFAELIGLERERILGKSDHDLFPKEQADSSQRKDLEVFLTGDVVEIPRESVTDAEDMLHFIHTKRAPLKDAAGNITHLIAILEDVTLLKQVEQALVEKERIVEERARLLADLRKLDDIDRILTRVCEAVRDSGLFERAVMTLHKPGGNIFNLGQVGLPADVVEHARKAPPISRKLKAKITSQEFRISDSFFVPVEVGLGLSKSGRYVPQKKANAQGDDWRSGDELFVPLRDFSGKTMGYLSVDTPTDGSRPDLKTIQALEILVEAAASRVREIDIHQALRSERDFSQSILDTANSMIVCLDADAKITVFNQECEKVTGYRREEVLGKRWPELFLPPNERHKELKSFARWVRSRPRDRYEGPILTKGGETRTILWSNTAILGPGKRDLTAIAIGHDITERNRSRQVLQQSERRYRSLFEDSPISLWEEDFSEVKRYIDRLQASGVKDFRAYFESHPKAVVKCASLVRVVDVNQASLCLYGAETKEQLISGLGKILARESYHPFREELISIAQGKTVFERDGLIQDLKGKKKSAVIRWSVAPGCEDTLSKVLVTISDITERKQAEEALRESEQRFRAIFDHAIDGIVIADAKGKRFYTANRAFCRMLGYTLEEIASLGVRDIHPQEEFPFVMQQFEKQRRREVALAQNVPVRRKDSSVFYADINSAPITLAGKTYVMGIFRNITQRKEAEEALGKSEEKYRLLVENLTDMIVKFDIDGRLLFASPSYCRTFGKSEEQILGKKFMPLIHKDDRAYVEKALAETYKPPHVVYLEERAKTVDGWRWQAWMNTAMLDEKGDVAGIVGVGRDITQRKQAEEALRRQEERYRTLVETAQEGIGITDPHENLTFVNQAFADLLGYRKDEILGKSLKDFSDLSQYDIFKKETAKRKTGATSKYEAVLLTKSGKPKPVYVSAAPIAGEDGSFTGALGVLSDLTEIKKVQQYNILLNTSRSLARGLNSDQVLQVGTEKMAQPLKVDRCAIMRLEDPTPDAPVTLNIYSPSRKKSDGARVMKLTFSKDLLSAYQRSLRAHGGMQVYDARSDMVPELAKLILRKAGMVSALIIPVFQRNRMLAVFHMGTIREPRTFTTDQVRLALTMGNQVGAALQNCRLMDDLKSEHYRIVEQAKLLKARYSEQRMMFELTQLLTSTHNLDQLLKSAAMKVVQLLRTERASVVLADADGGSATIKAVYPQASEQNRGALGYTFTPGIYPQEWRQLISDNKPFVCSDLSALSKNSPAAKYFRSRGIKSTVAIPLVSRGNILGFLTASTIEKTHQFTQDEIRLLRAISDPIAVAIENYQLLEDLRRKYDQIEEQADTLEKRAWEKDVLLRVSQALSKAMNLDEVSRVASQVVGEAMEADRCAVLLATPDGGQLEVKALFCKDRRRARKMIGRRFLLKESRALREFIKKGKTLILDRSSRWPDTEQARRHWSGAGIKSTLAAGMFFGKTMIGVLSVSFTGERRGFTRDESKLIQAIASQIAVAVENARLLEVVEKHSQDVRRLAADLMNAQESARKNVAQELHDQLGQMLLSMKMNLDRMQRDLSARPDHPKHTQDMLSDTRELLAQTIEKIRTLTFELRPPVLEDFGLIPALRWLLERFTKRSGTQSSFKTKGKERRYLREIDVSLFRIAQEALTNVSKHARATEVSVLVSNQVSHVIMSVRDNGVGFDTEKVLSNPRSGMGLLNIKERVDLLGGKFEILSQPRKGTTLNINIPSSEVKHEEDQIGGR